MAGHSKDKLEKFAQALAEGKTPVTGFAVRRHSCPPSFDACDREALGSKRTRPWPPTKLECSCKVRKAPAKVVVLIITAAGNALESHQPRNRVHKDKRWQPPRIPTKRPLYKRLCQRLVE